MLTKEHGVAPWYRLSRHQAAARGIRLAEWLAVHEEHLDVRHSPSPGSGGVVAGVLTVQQALGWIYAPTAATARLEAPPGASHVLARASLLAEDRDGWLRRPVGVPALLVTPYFGDRTVYWRTLMARAEAEAARLGVPYEVRRVALAA